MDETWIHHYTPESKQQSKQWIEAGCSGPKKARSVPSARKVMASVFWNAEGILFIDYLEKVKQ
jgi:histone-lysine N-methyltransferase SETMAR